MVQQLKPLALRPWHIASHYLRLLTNKHYVHYDLFAYRHTETNRLYARVICTHAGRRVLAEQSYYFDTAQSQLYETDAIPSGALAPVYWTRASNAFLRVAHPYMLARCILPDGYTRRAVLVHYVTRTDALAVPGWGKQPLMLMAWHKHGKRGYRNTLPDWL